MRRVSVREVAVRSILIAVLVGLATLKIASGYDVRFATPRFLYWSVTVMQLLLAAAIGMLSTSALLVTRPRGVR